MHDPLILEIRLLSNRHKMKPKHNTSSDVLLPIISL